MKGDFEATAELPPLSTNMVSAWTVTISPLSMFYVAIDSVWTIPEQFSVFLLVLLTDFESSVVLVRNSYMMFVIFSRVVSLHIIRQLIQGERASLCHTRDHQRWCTL